VTKEGHTTAKASLPQVSGDRALMIIPLATAALAATTAAQAATTAARSAGTAALARTARRPALQGFPLDSSYEITNARFENHSGYGIYMSGISSGVFRDCYVEPDDEGDALWEEFLACIPM
jgi:hypothetical protein